MTQASASLGQERQWCLGARAHTGRGGMAQRLLQGKGRATRRATGACWLR